jgi:hypothetical protein
MQPCYAKSRLGMSETPRPSRFKTEMPQIPGVTSPSSQLPRRNPLLPLIVGVVILGVILVLSLRWFAHSRPAESTRVEPTPQLEVPAPPPDPNSLLAHASRARPAIADISVLSKPWASEDFFIRDELTGEDIPATIVRLPNGPPTTPAGYWAFSRKAPYGNCKLEYVSDLAKLRTEYDFPRANHPLAGNPCSRTLYDPLKTASLPGNVFVRGAIVQGSDIRPPLGVEIQIQGKQILAIRSE